MDSETLRFIKEEIQRQLNVILPGRSSNSTTQTEDIEEMFPGMPTITNRPVMHPYGLSSAAPQGTIQVVARNGSHFGNRMILGHRDGSAPSVVSGEVVLYNQYGGRIELRQNSLTIQRAEMELLEILIRLLRTIINARTNTIFGPQPLIPDPAGSMNGELFTQIMQDLETLRGE